MAKIDINCDMGESFGAWQMGDDLALMQYITSANIACGFHAGDADVMLATVKAAVAHGVAIGAHPGLQDLQGFGRRTIAMSPNEVYALIVYQVGALQAFTKTQGTRLHHVKTHGALYNMTAKDPALAKAVAQAVYDIDPCLMVYVANENIAKAVESLGLPVAYEVYADRSYQDDGTLTPRSMPHAMIEDVDASIQQVIGMAKDGTVRALSGKVIPIRADTLCIHGDQPNAALFAQKIKHAMVTNGIEVSAI
jgi:UPF0271 protein